VGEGLKLREHERRPLDLGEVAKIRQEVAEICSALNVLVEPGRGHLDLAGVLVVAPGAQHAEAAVAGNGVEPGLEVDVAVVTL